MMEVNTKCWCGGTQFDKFSSLYLKCKKCKTLVLTTWPSQETFRVVDDQKDFYGKKYYDSHLTSQYGYPALAQRAITDLPERCLYWLRAVMKYKLPPGRALELGCGHGGFVALLRWSGFDASGLELSPGLVDFARETFDIPMFLGPIEDQKIEKESLDVIALMDVLEHLPDPMKTMKHCFSLLKQTGIVLVQTPRYDEGKTYEQMKARQDPFLEQFKEKEHIYLFSENSIREFFHRLGSAHIVSEPAYFPHYDMFLVVSRRPLKPKSDHLTVQSLSQTIGGRMIMAMLDVDNRCKNIENQLKTSESDRAKRLTVIEEQGRKLVGVGSDRDRRPGAPSQVGRGDRALPLRHGQ